MSRYHFIVIFIIWYPVLIAQRRKGIHTLSQELGFFFLIANVSGKQYTKKRQGKAERNSYIIIAVYFCIII